MKPMDVRVAVAQIDCVVGDLKRNVAHHERIIERAIEEKAGLIVFPELSLTGYSLRDLAWDVAVDIGTNPILNRLKKQSKRISIALGLVESGSDHGIYNSAVFLEDGKVKHVHRKIYLPSYGMFEEGRYFGQGSSVHAFDSRFGRFGMLICEDAWHMSVPYALAMDGAEALLCLTASPTRMAGAGKALGNADINHEHLRAYARLLSSYVVFSNRTGFEDGVNFWGGSLIVGPSGDSLAKGKMFEEDLQFANLSSNDITRARRLSRHVLDEDPLFLVDTIQRNMRARPR